VISTKRFANKLRELDYCFKEQKHHQNVWRKKGGTHIVMVPRKNEVTELWVEQTLKMAISDELLNFAFFNAIAKKAKFKSSSEIAIRNVAITVP